MSKRVNNKRGMAGYRNRHKLPDRNPFTGKIRRVRKKRRGRDGTMR